MCAVEDRGAPRLIYASRRPPYPLDNGSRIRAHRLLTGLAKSFSTTLLTYDHRPGSPDGAVASAELAETLPGVNIVTVPGLSPRKRLGQATSLLGTSSWEFGRYQRRAFARRLNSLVVQERPAVVHFDDVGVGAYTPIAGALNVFGPHNIEYRVLEGNVRASTGPRRAFTRLEGQKVAREERRLWRKADLVLAVSEQEAELIRAGGAEAVAVCPNGTDELPLLALEPRRPGGPLRLLFIGSGSYRPYEVGLSWFAREVYPRVAAALPTQFDVVGQPPRHPVESPGITYHGRVPSVMPYYERAHALVVPVFEGAGTRLKILEAIACGRPVVSTRLGAEGLPIKAGEHYLCADDPLGLARALLELAEMLEHPERAETMVKRARAAIEPMFWSRITGDLVQLYRRILAERAAA